MNLPQALTLLASLTACGLALAAYINVRQHTRRDRCTGKCRTNTGSRSEALEMHPDHWKNKIRQGQHRRAFTHHECPHCSSCGMKTSTTASGEPFAAHCPNCGTTVLASK